MQNGEFKRLKRSERSDGEDAGGFFDGRVSGVAFLGVASQLTFAVIVAPNRDGFPK